MPDPEPHFFSREYELGTAHYRRWFESAPADAGVIGEKSADYLSDGAVPAKLGSLLPDAKLIIQLRDPVERAYSDYKMLFRRGEVGPSPEEYLTSIDNDQPRFLHDGLYGQHIARWLDHFGKEQILCFRIEDVTARPRQILERMSQHIGVTPVFKQELARRSENDSKARLLPLPMRKLLKPLKETVKPLRGQPVFEGVRSLFERDVKYPPLSAALRRQLEDFYAADIELTESLLDIDLASWRCRNAVAA